MASRARSECSESGGMAITLKNAEFLFTRASKLLLVLSALVGLQ